MNATKIHQIGKAKHKLASGILGQARRDLRKFQHPRTALERELYLDAYTWVVSDNYSWPFSFLNVCRLLNLAPAEVRHDLLYELSLGVWHYWGRRFGYALRLFHVSLRQVFASEGHPRLALAKTFVRSQR